MDREQLRPVQKPLKERYEADPGAALATLRAERRLDQQDILVGGRLRAEGDLDFRGTLGMASDQGAPVGFRAIRLIFELESDASDDQLATLLHLAERYRVVYQTLRGVPISISRTSGRAGAPAA